MSTPVQRQYWELKNKNPDAILFFRLGDFYEIFYDDAVLCSKLLGIALTARHKKTDNQMPMCGFPYHSHAQYLEKIIEAGYKVAIAEQKETDGVISRFVDRVITPGTTQENGNLDPTENNYLAAILVDLKNEKYSLAYTDLSTGDFKTAELQTQTAFFDEIYKINPKEILCSHDLFEQEDFLKKLPESLVTPRTFLNKKKSTEKLKQHFPQNHLEISGLQTLENLIIVASQVLNYLQETQKGELEHIQKIIRYTPSETMYLDRQTLQHLEVFQNIQSHYPSATLWSVFAKSSTAMGGRNLRNWILRPLQNAEKIKSRSQGVEVFVKNTELCKNLSEVFRNIADIERILARISSGRGNGRDLMLIKNSLSALPEIQKLLEKREENLIATQLQKLGNFEEIFNLLDSAIQEEPPLEITAGGIFKSEYNDRLKHLRGLGENSDRWLQNFLDENKKSSGISNLRVKYSKNFGFCLEVSKAQSKLAPTSWTRKQTLVNAERYTTPELAKYETEVLSAQEEAYELEYRLFLDLREKVLNFLPQLQKTAQAVAVLDTLLTLGKTAQKHRWTKPEISQENGKFYALGVRHPVVESLSEEIFIANDLKMGHEKNYFHLLTGPNMAGKSTFLRQNAILILLGQIGSFVPAKSAKFSVFDRIFTRVGASDNLAAGKSTFFVEMAETATILHAATERSFIILDEIGRGTSTFDGISLAWAISEFLHHKIGAKTIFATHYHELIDLTDRLKGGENYHVSVSQNKKGIVFLRQVKKGGISDSFGVEVAKLAGLPKSVIQKSREVLARLESENMLSGNLNLFSLPPQNIPEKITEPIPENLLTLEENLKNINPDELSPKEALEKLYELTALIK